MKDNKVTAAIRFRQRSRLWLWIVTIIMTNVCAFSASIAEPVLLKRHASSHQIIGGNEVDISPNGAWAVVRSKSTSSYDITDGVTIYDLSTGRKVFEDDLDGLPFSAQCVAVSNTRAVVLSRSGKAVNIYRLDTSGVVRIARWGASHQIIGGNEVDISPNGAWAVVRSKSTSSYDITDGVTIYDLSTGQKVFEDDLDGLPFSDQCVAVSNTRAVVLSRSDKAVNIYRLDTSGVVRIARWGASHQIIGGNEVDISPNGAWAVVRSKSTSSYDITDGVTIYDLSTGQKVFEEDLDGLPFSAQCVAVSNTRAVVLSRSGKAVNIYRLDTSGVVRIARWGASHQIIGGNEVDISPNGAWAVVRSKSTSSYDITDGVTIYDLSTGQKVFEDDLDGLPFSAQCVAVCNCRAVVLSRSDKTVNIYRLDITPPALLKRHASSYQIIGGNEADISMGAAIAVVRNKSTSSYGILDGVTMYDLATGEEVFRDVLDGLPFSAQCVAVCDTRAVVLSRSDKAVSIYDFGPNSRTRSFAITGGSNNTGWSLCNRRLNSLPSDFHIHDLTVEPIGYFTNSGDTAAAACVNSINAAAAASGTPWMLSAFQWAPPLRNCFSVTAAGRGYFDHCYGPYWGPANDCVTSTNPVNFNPTIEEIFLSDMDCNSNGIPDAVDIAEGTSLDGNDNGVPDECEGPGTGGFPVIKIEKTHNTLQGHYETVSIMIENSDLEMGGFNFLIAYDASALALPEATPGQLLEDCGWEYFTYRHGADGNCGDACPSGLLRIFAIAETNNGPNHPSCYGPPDYEPHELAEIRFLVTNDRTFECQYVPIYFFWTDCGDNTVSSMDGEVLYIDHAIYDFEENLIWNEDDDDLFPEDARLPHVGAPDFCINPDPDKPTAIRYIDFMFGGINIICADSIDDRGDINLNGTANEIADAVLFTNYFVHGISVFNVNIDGQIAASDVNADGITLSVADLVYQIRIIVGDALPYPKLSPVTADADLVDGVLSVNTEMGAAYVVVENSMTPLLLAELMEMKYHYDEDNNLTRILVYSMEPDRRFSGDFLGGIDGNVMTLEMATYEGAPVTTKLVPDAFALYPCYPNPFNPITTISFALAAPVDYELVIYNALGQTVETFSGRSGPGLERIDWNASALASGVYFYRLTAGDFNDTKKMVLLK